VTRAASANVGAVGRFASAALLTTTLFALLALPAQAAPPCDSPEALYQGRDSPITVSQAPDRLTFDRLANVHVYHDAFSITKALSARLDYVDANRSLFFTHVFSAEEIDPGPNGKTLKFPIQLGADSGQVLVRLIVTQQQQRHPDEPGDPYPPCEVVQERIVRPFPGRGPRFQLLLDDVSYFEQSADLSLGIDHVCERIAPGEVRVLVSHHGRRRGLMLRLDPPCEDQAMMSGERGSYEVEGSNFGWRRSGRVIPGLRFRRPSAGLVHEGPLGIFAVGRRRWTRVYRVDAFWNARRMLRRWIRASHRYKPARRIYEDSDNFEEACTETSGEEGPPIHRDKRGSYCVEPGQHETRVRVLAARPKPRRR
jgi:hypothetical protein